MNKIKFYLLEAKWYLIAVGIFLIAVFVRCFGASSKQPEYKKVIEDFMKDKRDTLHAREDELSDSIVKEEELKIDESKGRIILLEKELEKRAASGRNTPVNSKATARRLEELGLK